MPLRTSYQIRRASLSKKRKRYILLSALFVVVFFASLRIFYLQNTELVPSKGGTYIEGSVGMLQPLNPWYTVTNDVNRDIVSLVFAGLQRYNPLTESIVDDLATVAANETNTVYTATLRDNVFWHDHTPDNPHPVTAEDVLFTFNAIQSEAFSNSLLRQNFSNVDIEQIDEKTVRFTLPESYIYFPSNLTIGLLPKRSFEGLDVSQFQQALDFAYNPIGAGPYKFKGSVQTELSTEVTLVRFSEYTAQNYHLESIVFRIFPDYRTLLFDLRNLQGVRLVPSNDKGTPLVPSRFLPIKYSLPQYVALYLNLDRGVLSDERLRLALQLGTDKNTILKEIHQEKRVDTPLLELEQNDWRFDYSVDSARGALFQSDWNLPEKMRLQELLEFRDANLLGVLDSPAVSLLKDSAVLVLSGSIVDVGSTSGSRINTFPLQADGTNSGTWRIALPMYGKDGLKIGLNRLQLINDAEQLIDTAYVQIYDNQIDYDKAIEEQKLLEEFVLERKKPEGQQQITVNDLYLDGQFMRRKKESDPTEIRINNRGEKLSLTLLTSPTPPEYTAIAKMIKDQWLELGVHVSVEIPESYEQFEQRMIARDYDVLLFGQSLLDNLDSYPYWHSSGIQSLSTENDRLAIDAYNLSQYASLEADILLERIRATTDEAKRNAALKDLQSVLNKDIPAIVLYSPTYTFAYHEDVKGVNIGKPALHSDRFLVLNNWFVREERKFTNNTHWLDYPFWLIKAVFWFL